MSSAADLSARPVPAHQRRDLVPVAASSCLDRPMTPEPIKFTAEPARLAELASECRFSSWAFMLRAYEEDAKAGYPTHAGSDLMANAVRLQQASSLLDQLAQDAELLRIARWRAAGGTVTCTSAMVVVGQEEDEALLPPDHPGLLAWLARRLGLRRKVA